MKKKVLIIGFGSIGKRHAKILKNFKNISKIYILTKYKCNNFIKVNNISDVRIINPDYIIICSRTRDHLQHLSYLEKTIRNKTILVEKPLFKNFNNLKIKNNKVFIGYNLRYHPVIKFIKNYISNKKIFSVNISCHSYLPNWRKKINYSKTNSAKNFYGGGVLLELSHEIDYFQWIFKKIKKIDYAKLQKISKLKIDTEDSVSIIGKTNSINFLIDLNYFSLYSKRIIIINSNNFTLMGDLINNSIEIFKKNNKKKKIKFKIDENYTYKEQHKYLLDKKYKNSCSYTEGLKLMLLFDKIKFFIK